MTTCSTCAISLPENYFTCNKCQTAHFCSRSCAKNGWFQHRKVCQPKIEYKQLPYWIELTNNDSFTYSNFQPCVHGNCILFMGGGRTGLTKYDINQDKYCKDSFEFPEKINDTSVSYDSCGVSCITQNDYYLCGGSSYNNGPELGTNLFRYDFNKNQWYDIQATMKTNIMFGLYPQITAINDHTLHIMGGTENNLQYEYDANMKSLKLVYTFDSNIFAAILVHDVIKQRLILLGGKYLSKEKTKDEPGKYSNKILIGTTNSNDKKWKWSTYNGFQLNSNLCDYDSGYVFLPFLRIIVLFGNDESDIWLLDFNKNTLIESKLVSPTKKVCGAALVGNDIHLFEKPNFWNFNGRKQWKVNVEDILNPYHLKRKNKINLLAIDGYIRLNNIPFELLTLKNIISNFLCLL